MSKKSESDCLHKRKMSYAIGKGPSGVFCADCDERIGGVHRQPLETKKMDNGDTIIVDDPMKDAAADRGNLMDWILRDSLQNKSETVIMKGRQIGFMDAMRRANEETEGRVVVTGPAIKLGKESDGDILEVDAAKVADFCRNLSETYPVEFNHPATDEEFESNDDEYVRAQLADGLRGKWEPNPWGGDVWSLEIADGFRAYISMSRRGPKPYAFGHIKCAAGSDRFQVMPHTRVDANFEEDGDHYIRICTERLAEKVEVVREMADKLQAPPD